MKTYRAQRGIGFWLALAAVVFLIASVAVAVSTSDRCEPLDQRWVIAPPHWECVHNLPGRG